MNTNLAKAIDHTLLKPSAREVEILQLCREAVEFGFFSVCVNGSRVETAVKALEGTDVVVAAVTGFPLGAMAPEIKARETATAIADGASEIDTVLNVGLLLDDNPSGVLADLRGVVNAGDGRTVKVILETGLLTDEQKRLACKIAVDAGAGFVKTSTGFGPGGATVEDVRLMKEAVGGAALVKASGGIRDRETALTMLGAGASRLGTSSGIAIVGGTPPPAPDSY
jgi:deoxyribose-phosphate aldolase